MTKFEAISAVNVRGGPGTTFDILDTLDRGDIVEEMEVPRAWCPVKMEDGTPGWVSRSYLKAAPPGVTPALPPLAGEPAWIAWARKQIGQREVPGPGNNPVIQAWYHLTTLPEYLWTDSTAWCAVFVNAALMLNNIATPRSARAYDWLEFGLATDSPRKGDLVIFNFSHIGFYMGSAGPGRLYCMGGNQSDEVNITSYSEKSVRAYRRVE